MMTVKKAWQDYREIEYSFNELTDWIGSGKIAPDERDITNAEKFHLYRLLAEIQKTAQDAMFSIAIDLLPDAKAEVAK